jgi:hypothetical protein
VKPLNVLAQSVPTERQVLHPQLPLRVEDEQVSPFPADAEAQGGRTPVESGAGCGQICRLGVLQLGQARRPDENSLSDLVLFGSQLAQSGEQALDLVIIGLGMLGER